ncbi:MAG: threonylcarbamoyl-AMP synthase [Gammaproteobacteria bacterium RIFCSPLOWO2_12_FULL_52_10]|nr:MAG: threonylcarbamoyl-AMP synthase [Gammaproteobacteria bacterium RIFCSPLOWO2_12_FULL_52_10]
MAQFLQIHTVTPQERLIDQAAAVLRAGGIIVYPTDSCYALGALSVNKAAVERITRIRRLAPKHNMTLICRDLSDIGIYARLDNTAFRFIKSLTPGPYTFLLKATRGVPRRLQHPQKKTIGLRIPDNRIALSLLESLGEPMLSTSLILPGRELPETEPDEIRQLLENQVDLIIDGGAGGHVPTTVLDLTAGSPTVIRAGKGEVSQLITSHKS